MRLVLNSRASNTFLSTSVPSKSKNKHPQQANSNLFNSAVIVTVKQLSVVMGAFKTQLRNLFTDYKPEVSSTHELVFMIKVLINL